MTGKNNIYLILIFFITSNLFSQNLTQSKKQECDSNIIIYSKLIEKNPGESDNYYERGKWYSICKYYDLAVEDLDKAIKLKESFRYYIRRAVFYYQKYIDESDIISAENSWKDFSKAKNIDPVLFNNNFQQYSKYYNVLEKIFNKGDITNHEKLENNLHRFILKNSDTLYVRFPELLPLSFFNIIKQDPNSTGSKSTKFLLNKGRESKFIEILASCIDEIQRDQMLLIITIDDNTKVGVQEGLEYGSDTLSMIKPDKHSIWIDDEEVPVTGLIKLNNEATFAPIKHSGKLKLRVLHNGKPVRSIIEVSNGCPNDNNYFNKAFNVALEEVTIDIGACYVVPINVRLALPKETRWLLSRYEGERLFIEDYYLEVNGRILPNNRKYLKFAEDEEGNKFVDFNVPVEMK